MFAKLRALGAFGVVAATSIYLTPALSWACACGCGIFDVGTSAMFPTRAGVMVYLEDDFLDQTQNRNLTSRAPAANNADQEIRTHFAKVGGQYMFNRDWGARVEVPYWDRYFRTVGDSGPTSFTHGALGDIRVSGVYTGFSEDMSTGLIFGLKLPTGDSTYANFDPDTEIGTGSTDLLVGAYHLVKISNDGAWNAFGQINFQQPVATKASYIPGNEIDAAMGSYYSGWSLGDNARITPILAALFSFRGSDTGSLGHPTDSGFRRLLVAPGVEADIAGVRVYGDIEVPLYQYFIGNQLAAPFGFKVAAMYMF